MTDLLLRRANVSRKSGEWQNEDYDVFDGDRDIGRIYLVDGHGGRENWFWGVSFQVTRRKSYGYPVATACPCCGGGNLRKIGEDVTETLELVPRQWKVIQHVREKFSCRACEPRR